MGFSKEGSIFVYLIKTGVLTVRTLRDIFVATFIDTRRTKSFAPTTARAGQLQPFRRQDAVFSSQRWSDSDCLQFSSVIALFENTLLTAMAATANFKTGEIPDVPFRIYVDVFS
jgi:hypothetical protein